MICYEILFYVFKKIDLLAYKCEVNCVLYKEKIEDLTFHVVAVH